MKFVLSKEEKTYYYINGKVDRNFYCTNIFILNFSHKSKYREWKRLKKKKAAVFLSVLSMPLKSNGALIKILGRYLDRFH